MVATRLRSLVACAVLGLLAVRGAHAQEAAEPAPAEEAVAADGEPQPAEDGEPTVTVETKTVKSYTFFERIRQGGWTMLFLALLSVMSVTFTIERLVNLRKQGILPEGLADEARALWDAGKYDELQAKCRETPSALGTIIDGLVQYRQTPYVEISALASDMGAREIKTHLQKCYPLAVSGTLAPLLGLFGTVLGMIEAFEIVAIAGSLGDASLLAGSISKALITTAGGLLVAIPSLGIYHFIKTRINSYAMSLEEEVNELLAAWFLKGAESKA